MPLAFKPLSLRVIGHNAGTSMDGLDIVHVHFTQKSPDEPLNCRLLRYGEVEMPRPLKKKVMHLIKSNSTSPEEISVVNIRLGEFVAGAVKQFASEQGFSLQEEVDVIAGQGQTIWHLPLPGLFPGRDVSGAHLDMSEISIIAAETGITTMGNFRVSDFSLGRQGCPLFAAFDSLLVNHATMTRAVQNIGGIANFSISMAGGDATQCFDFDTGPGNVFIDAAMRYFTNGNQEYDRDGAMGAKGKVDQSVVDEYLKHPYFSQEIPKTTGRETFGDNDADKICEKMIRKCASPEDCVATITRITAQSMADHYERYAPQPLDEIYMGGGGSRNPNIVDYLRQRLPETRITTVDELGVPLGAKEALGFAFLGCEGSVGRPVTVPLHVESRREGVIGHIQPGDNYFELRRDMVRFWGDTPAKEVRSVRKMHFSSAYQSN